MNYLYGAMAHAPAEELRALFLNTRNVLLKDEVLGIGSVSQAPFFPREIVRRALDLGASALILAHNHPSGDPMPSEDDVRATRQIAAAARLLDIALHDHVIVARSGWTSLRTLNLLAEH